MALDDTAVVIPGTGHFLYADTATATQPTQADLDAFVTAGTTITGWTDFGHTDLEDVLAFGSEGGETEVRGSWQNKSLREAVTEEVVDYLTFKSLQVRDADILTFYYGGRGGTPTAGTFELPDSSAPQEKAVLVVMNDSDGAVGFYVPKGSVRREGPIETASDDFVKLPLRVTFLKATGSPRAVWIADSISA